MGSEENHIVPLAPSEFHPRSDEEFATVKPYQSRPQRRSSKCFVYLLTLFVILFALLLIFATIVMRPKTPEVELTSVAAKRLSYATSPTASFNVTVDAELSVKNSNFGGFEYCNTTATVLYEDTVVGEVKIREGKVKGRQTERIRVLIDLTTAARGSWEGRNLSSDMNSGMIKLRSYAEMRGRVKLMHVVKKEKTAFMDCTMMLNLTSRSLGDLSCL